MKFYLGTHEPHWLHRTRIPLFISRRRLARQRTWARAWGPWALDSGGFTELREHGRWTVGAADYADEIIRWADMIGGLEWAAPQDWMCEPVIRAKTGLSVREHQIRTIASVVELRDRVCGAVNVIPVLQGFAPIDYFEHLDMYAAAGLDLRAESVVGVGSVCRRQSSREIAGLLTALARTGLRLHGFGVKTEGLGRIARHLASADSMAWSMAGRLRPLPDCVHPRGGKSCANCMRYAFHWRESVLSAARPQVPRWTQLQLWT